MGANIKYVVITPARNEEDSVENLANAMVAQTTVPQEWIVVDDGSTDRTAEIVQGYSQEYEWIPLCKRPNRGQRAGVPNVPVDTMWIQILGDLGRIPARGGCGYA